MPNPLPPTECYLTRQGRHFTCLEVSLPPSEVCQYCKHEVPKIIAQEARSDRELEELEYEMLNRDLQRFGREW